MARSEDRAPSARRVRSVENFPAEARSGIVGHPMLDLAQSRERAAADLRRCSAHWREELERALLGLERRRRKLQKLPPLSENARAYLPSGSKADLMMLNLRAWKERYQVSAEFLLEALTHAYRGARRVDERKDCATLGLPAAMVTGIRARKIVEEAVVRAFPNGENYRSRALPPQELPMRLNYEDPDEMIKSYARAVERRRRARQRKARAARPYRRPGGRW